MIVTPAKLAANRANARKSTGPRTARGKKRSSMNGVTHGIFCNHVVLPGEDPKLFESMRESILMKLCPQDIVELMIIDRIVIAQWKLRRLNEVESLAHESKAHRRNERAREKLEKERNEEKLLAVAHDRKYQPDAIDTIREQLLEQDELKLDAVGSMVVSVMNDEPFIERLNRYEQRLELSIHRNLRQLERLRKQTQTTGAPPIAQCPFLPAEPYERAREIMRELDQNEQSEPKDEDEEEEESTTRNTKNTKRSKPSESASNTISREDATASNDYRDAPDSTGIVQTSQVTMKDHETSAVGHKIVDSASGAT